MNAPGSHKSQTDRASPPATTLAASPNAAPTLSAPSSASTVSEIPSEFGRYRVLKQLGQGGMGAVYLARDTQLERLVALKVPRFSPGAESSLHERFYREAKAAATLNHPHLCPIFDVGERNGVPYMTLAYIEGRPLTDYLQPGRPQGQRQSASLIRKLALAVAEAHAQGVVHRDLKPSNIMINQRKEPVVMDFGLACLTERADDRLTQEGTILGTPAYMAPEQVSGDPQAIGPACDIYSLGVIFYQMLTSELPFQGSVAAVLGQIVSTDPTPPSSLRNDLDPRLEAACLRAMAKNPAARFASMQDFATVLEDYLRATGGPPEASRAEAFATAMQTPPATLPTAQDLVETIGREMQRDVAAAPMTFAVPRTPRTSEPRWFLAVLGGVVATMALTAIVVTLDTKNGVVVLEVNEPGAEVTIDDRERITVAGADHEPIQIEVEAGKHELTVAKGGFVTQTRSFTVRRGAEVALSVRLEPAPQAVPPSQKEAPEPAKEDNRTNPSPAPAVGTAPQRSPSTVGSLPRNQWIPIDETTHMNSWVWDKPSRKTEQKNWEGGVLTLENRGCAFRSIRGEDVSFRAQVNFIEGNHLALIVRGGAQGGKSPIYALADRLDNGKIYIAMLNRRESRVVDPEGEFFELRLTVVGDQVTVQVNGATVIQYTETQRLGAGHVEITAYDATAKFKEMEVKILDP